MRNKKTKFSNIYLVFVFIIMYLPLVYLIFYSFNSGGNMTSFEGFTFDHYISVFEDKRLINIVFNTAILALLSSLIATIIGTLGAISIYYMRSNKLRKKVLSLNSVLMVLPDVMMGASFLILFSFLLKIPMGFFSVLLSHIAFSIPIVVLMVLPRLYALNRDMMKAAEDLGASDMTILNRIILPNIASGIFSGFFMALTYSLDDFAVTFFVTGSGFSTLSVEIYSRVRTGISLEINALSSLIFLISLLMVIGYYLIQRKEKRLSYE
ncbi:ABC transporter permease [Anaerococcus sp. AGMB00486]|uniref:ABC transporter permease n=1 Tax=Anaerococcus faecalis TaxID=2742993 RepID=A0ABX2NAM7_9FIRM|nr:MULTISPECIES: ABC transporter permease [Anaerococcus]MDY3005678.1 ABC transporter permease [Anaerococcus porci]NVF11609.1 ABC transporter permease [Anaerococcus faecalis]